MDLLDLWICVGLIFVDLCCWALAECPAGSRRGSQGLRAPNNRLPQPEPLSSKPFPLFYSYVLVFAVLCCLDICGYEGNLVSSGNDGGNACFPSGAFLPASPQMEACPSTFSGLFALN